MVSFYKDSDGKTRPITTPQHPGLLSASVIQSSKPSRFSRFVSAKNTTKKAIELARQKKKELDEKREQKKQEIDDKIDSIIDSDMSPQSKFNKLHRYTLDNQKYMTKGQRESVKHQLVQLDNRIKSEKPESTNETKTEKPDDSNPVTFADMPENLPEPEGDKLPVGSPVHSEQFGDLIPEETKANDRLKEYVTFANEG